MRYIIVWVSSRSLTGLLHKWSLMAFAISMPPLDIYYTHQIYITNRCGFISNSNGTENKVEERKRGREVWKILKGKEGIGDRERKINKRKNLEVCFYTYRTSKRGTKTVIKQSKQTMGNENHTASQPTYRYKNKASRTRRDEGDQRHHHPSATIQKPHGVNRQE